MQAETPLFLGVRVGTVGACVLVLLLVAIAHFGLDRYAARRARERDANPPPVDSPRDRSLRQTLFATLLRLVPPLALILWIIGLHFALSILFSDIDYPAVSQYGLPALNAARGIGIILALVWLLSRVGRTIEDRLQKLALRTRSRSDDFFLPIVGTAVRLLLPLLAIILGTSTLAVPARLQVLFSNAVSMLLVAAIAYVLYRMVDAACDLLLERYRVDVPDNREARAVHTQVTVLRKVAIFVIAVFGFAAMLMVFEQVRQVGATILASAGVAGIVIGFAAQRSLGALLGGFQLALTQPIRLDDAVTVEGEFGRIEEITLTYVVVNLWDRRRLIVPVTYFLESPFQNWSRSTTELLCTVEIFVDYDMPLEKMRSELTRLLQASKFWDGRVNVLQVTDAREHMVQVRALMSASNAGLASDLRNEVREGLLRMLQRECPRSLPRLRVVDPERAAAADAQPLTRDAAPAGQPA